MATPKPKIIGAKPATGITKPVTNNTESLPGTTPKPKKTPLADVVTPTRKAITEGTNATATPKPKVLNPNSGTIKTGANPTTTPKLIKTPGTGTIINNPKAGADQTPPPKPKTSPTPKPANTTEAKPN